MYRLWDILRHSKHFKSCLFEFKRGFRMPRDKTGHRAQPYDWTGRRTGGRLLKTPRIRALPFPPNYAESLHVFPKDLASILAEKNKIENSVKFEDIGLAFEMRPAAQLKSRKERMNTISGHVESVEDLINLTEYEVDVKEFNNEVVNLEWLRSEEGMKEVMGLAHNYEIYRDLFRDTTWQFKDNVVPVKFPDYYPRPERFMDKEIKEYFPGGVRIDYPEPRPVRIFKPIVPMHIEFSKDVSNVELDAFPVYRGNIIWPCNTLKKPNVVLDCSLLNRDSPLQTEPLSEHVKAGIVLTEGYSKDDLFTLGLFNLDTQFGDIEPLCHWLVCNIQAGSDDVAKFDEVMSYIPAYGIRGLGYSRYVFLLMKQEKYISLPKIQDNDLIRRKLDVLKFLNDKETKCKPIGLSWFQSTWDESCRSIFHDILDIREPAFEYIQPKETLTEQVKFPESAPFNIYLDHYRDPKEISKEVLLERLKMISPFEYKKLLKPSKLPPNIHMYLLRRGVPSWLYSTIWKRTNRLGPYRGLRNASKILPLDNNLDLDYPIWPHPSRLEVAMRHPVHDGFVPRRDSHWVLPPNEKPTIFVEHEDINETLRLDKREDEEVIRKIESGLNIKRKDSPPDQADAEASEKADG